MQELKQSGSVVLSTRMSIEAQSIALLVANVIGAILYVFAASRGGWAIPAERAAGIYKTTENLYLVPQYSSNCRNIPGD
ncbi:MAG: hypothetical protein WDN23_13630 [Edaphobacter sp.]